MGASQSMSLFPWMQFHPFFQKVGANADNFSAVFTCKTCRVSALVYFEPP